MGRELGVGAPNGGFPAMLDGWRKIRQQKVRRNVRQLIRLCSMEVKNVPEISRKSTIAAEKRVSQDRVDSLNRAPYKHVHRRRRCGDVVPASFCCLMLVQTGGLRRRV